MQRFLGNLLLALFSVQLLMPVLLSGGEGKLPACCRKDGKHKCGMRMGDGEEGGAQWAATKCPLAPQGGAVQSGGDWTAEEWTAAIAGVVAEAEDGVVREQSRQQLANGGVARKRGPPAEEPFQA